MSSSDYSSSDDESSDYEKPSAHEKKQWCKEKPRRELYSSDSSNSEDDEAEADPAEMSAELSELQRSTDDSEDQRVKSAAIASRLANLDSESWTADSLDVVLGTDSDVDDDQPVNQASKPRQPGRRGSHRNSHPNRQTNTPHANESDHDSHSPDEVTLSPAPTINRQAVASNIQGSSRNTGDIHAPGLPDQQKSRQVDSAVGRAQIPDHPKSPQSKNSKSKDLITRSSGQRRPAVIVPDSSSEESSEDEADSSMGSDDELDENGVKRESRETLRNMASSKSSGAMSLVKCEQLGFSLDMKFETAADALKACSERAIQVTDRLLWTLPVMSTTTKAVNLTANQVAILKSHHVQGHMYDTCSKFDFLKTSTTPADLETRATENPRPVPTPTISKLKLNSEDTDRLTEALQTYGTPVPLAATASTLCSSFRQSNIAVGENSLDQQADPDFHSTSRAKDINLGQFQAADHLTMPDTIRQLQKAQYDAIAHSLHQSTDTASKLNSLLDTAQHEGWQGDKSCIFFTQATARQWSAASKHWYISPDSDKLVDDWAANQRAEQTSAQMGLLELFMVPDEVDPSVSACELQPRRTVEAFLNPEGLLPNTDSYQKLCGVVGGTSYKNADYVNLQAKYQIGHEQTLANALQYRLMRLFSDEVFIDGQYDDGAGTKISHCFWQNTYPDHVDYKAELTNMRRECGQLFGLLSGIGSAVFLLTALKQHYYASNGIYYGHAAEFTQSAYLAAVHSKATTVAQTRRSDTWKSLIASTRDNISLDAFEPYTPGDLYGIMALRELSDPSHDAVTLRSLPADSDDSEGLRSAQVDADGSTQALLSTNEPHQAAICADIQEWYTQSLKQKMDFPKLGKPIQFFPKFAVCTSLASIYAHSIRASPLRSKQLRDQMNMAYAATKKINVPVRRAKTTAITNHTKLMREIVNRFVIETKTQFASFQAREKKRNRKPLPLHTDKGKAIISAIRGKATGTFPKQKRKKPDTKETLPTDPTQAEERSPSSSAPTKPKKARLDRKSDAKKLRERAAEMPQATDETIQKASENTATSPLKRQRRVEICPDVSALPERVQSTAAEAIRTHVIAADPHMSPLVESVPVSSRVPTGNEPNEPTECTEEEQLHTKVALSPDTQSHGHAVVTSEASPQMLGGTVQNDPIHGAQTGFSKPLSQSVSSPNITLNMSMKMQINSGQLNQIKDILERVLRRAVRKGTVTVQMLTDAVNDAGNTRCFYKSRDIVIALHTFALSDASLIRDGTVQYFQSIDSTVTSASLGLYKLFDRSASIHASGSLAEMFRMVLFTEWVEKP